jgi:hypothetical protein
MRGGRTTRLEIEDAPSNVCWCFSKSGGLAIFGRVIALSLRSGITICVPGFKSLRRQLDEACLRYMISVGQ